MKILVGWDHSEEADLISLYLNAGEHSADVVQDVSALVLKAKSEGPWDVVLMATGAPDPDAAFNAFREIHEARPNVPVIGACQTGEVVQLARFLTAGMRSYLLRDIGGDFVFLLLTTLESTVNAVQAERNQFLVDRLREEVDAVGRFQRGMIAEEMNSPAGYVIAGRYEPSEIVIRGEAPVVLAGGDYFDVFPLDRHRTGILVADAAGHGMQACMAVTILSTILQMEDSRRVRSAAEFVAEVNRRFCAHRIVKRQGNLMTLLFGVLRNDRHDIAWSSAGHPLPLLHDRDAGEFRQVDNGNSIVGPPLGVDADVAYREIASPVPRRARIVCYSDGLTESTPDVDSKHFFGLEGVKKTLTRMTDRTTADTVRTLLTDSAAFTQGAGRHDDTSVLLVDRV
jgi:phosphoserine phosphatase RsbU/P